MAESRSAADQPVAVWLAYRLRLPLFLLLALALISTVGYEVIEGYGWVDALYMTVITLGTIGYGEVHPLGTGGRIFTIGVIVASFATFVYAVSVVTNVFASGEAARHMKERSTRRMRDALSNHVIVVGFGRVGHAVVRSLHGSGRQCAVIDMNPDRPWMMKS